MTRRPQHTSVGVAAPAVTVTVTVGTAGHPLACTPSCLPLPPGIVELPGSVVPVGAALLAGGMLAGLVVFEAPPPVATPDVVGTGVRSGVVEFEGIEDVGTVPLVGGRGVPVVLLGGIETVGSVTLAGEPVVEGSGRKRWLHRNMKLDREARHTSGRLRASSLVPHM
jgi:hypothetical protein